MKPSSLRLFSPSITHLVPFQHPKTTNNGPMVSSEQFTATLHSLPGFLPTLPLLLQNHLNILKHRTLKTCNTILKTQRQSFHTQNIPKHSHRSPQSRSFSTTPPIPPEAPLIKPTTSQGFPSGGPNKSKIPPVNVGKKIVKSYPPEFFTSAEPMVGSHPLPRQLAEAEAYAPRAHPSKHDSIRQTHTFRRFFSSFFLAAVITTSLWATISGLTFLRLEWIRSNALSKFVHIYFPRDLESDPNKIGYLENYNNLLLEHIITAIRGVYTVKVHPELVPNWIREMVTKDGEIMNPLDEQPADVLLELCDVLSASKGMGSLLTVYSHFHEMYLEKQLSTKLGYKLDSIQGFILNRLHKMGWDGTQDQLDAFNQLDQYEMEAELCLPLVREQLHKHITSLLVPPLEAPKPSGAVHYIQSIVGYFMSTDGKNQDSSDRTASEVLSTVENKNFNSDNNNHNNHNNHNNNRGGQNQNINKYLKSQALLNKVLSEWEQTKSPEFNKIRQIITSLHKEAPLSSLIKQRRTHIEQVYIREDIPFTATLNETHYQIQSGRLETLKFIFSTLKSYETNLITTPHKLQQYAGDNQVIISLQDVRLLIDYCQVVIDGVNVLVEKYRVPTQEEVTRQICKDIPIFGWAMLHESTAISLFFLQREKLILNHFAQLDSISDYLSDYNSELQRRQSQPRFGQNKNNLTTVQNASTNSFNNTSQNLSWEDLSSLATSRQNDSPLPLDEHLKRDYLNILDKIQIGGTVTRWNNEVKFDRHNNIIGWELQDLTHIVRDDNNNNNTKNEDEKLIIPIINLKNPLETRLNSQSPQSPQSPQKDSNSGVLNTVYSWFGYNSKPRTIGDDLEFLTIEEALEKGAITQVEYKNHLKEEKQKNDIKNLQNVRSLGDLKQSELQKNVDHANNVSLVVDIHDDQLDGNRQAGNHIVLDPNQLRPQRRY